MFCQIRKEEYVSSIDEEFLKFQKEMKEENMLSEQIMADNEDEATYGRQVEEIDEQIKHWSKCVLCCNNFNVYSSQSHRVTQYLRILDLMMYLLSVQMGDMLLQNIQVLYSIYLNICWHNIVVRHIK